MMDDPCHELRLEVEAALEEWERVRAEETADPGSTDPSERPTPVMGGDLGTRFYESISRTEAASRRYRSAVRSLSECIRQNNTQPGIIGSAHG